MRYRGLHLLDTDGRRIASLPGVGVTETTLERTRGLLDRRLDGSNGLYIRPCNSVHTFGMPYALDLVYLDRHERVIKVRERVAPRRLSLSMRARGVLELKAGMAGALGIKQNMTVAWTDES